MKRQRLVPPVLLLALLLGSSACNKRFEPGEYVIGSVEEESPDDSLLDQPTNLRMRGHAVYRFEPGGQFIVDLDNFAIDTDPPCTGSYLGDWELVGSDQLVLMTKKLRRLPRECLPSRDIVYTWSRTWQGKLKLEKPWVEGKTTVYWLTPSR